MVVDGRLLFRFLAASTLASVSVSDPDVPPSAIILWPFTLRLRAWYRAEPGMFVVLVAV